MSLSAGLLAFQWRKGWKCLRIGGMDAAGERHSWNGNASKWLLSPLLCSVSAATWPWVCICALKWGVSCSLGYIGSYMWCHWPILASCMLCSWSCSLALGIHPRVKTCFLSKRLNLSLFWCVQFLLHLAIFTADSHCYIPVCCCITWPIFCPALAVTIPWSQMWICVSSKCLVCLPCLILDLDLDV